MSLKEKLEARKAQFREQAPQAAQDIMHRATEDLRASGILAKAVRAGDVAPDFALEDTAGRTVALGDLLDRGPLVLGFYRGRW
jgi:hypothetical protein